MSKDSYPLVVIGAGSAGGGVLAGALRAGVSAVMIEQAELGGECLNSGCIPSKALVRSAQIAHLGAGTDGAAALRRMRATVDVERGDRSADQAWTDVEMPAWHAFARFADAHTLAVTPCNGPGAPWPAAQGERLIGFEQAVIATGSRPLVPDLPGLDDCDCLTNESIMELEAVPASLLVIGGGPVGVEYAQAFARLGASVTLVEAGALLDKDEPEAGELLGEVFRDEGIEVILGARLARFGRDPDGSVVATLDDGRELRAERVLAATGREPVLDGIGLEAAGVEMREGGLVLDGRLRTSAPHIWAAGDVTGHMPFVHVASYHAAVVVANAIGGEARTVDYSAVPWATFTDPEVAHVGMTEAQAVEADLDAVIGRLDADELGRATTDGSGRGFVKVIAERPNGRILGGQVVLPAAGELIAELALGMSVGATVAQVRDTIHVYPTYSEGVRWACGAAAEHLSEV